MTRTLIFTHPSPAALGTEINRLFAAYHAETKRQKRLPDNMLFVSTWGGDERGRGCSYGITLYVNDHSQESAAEWIRANVGKGGEGRVAA